MSFPALVPFLFDREVYNGVPDSATLTRRLMRWQKWARGRWTRVSPMDGPIVTAGPGFSVWTPKSPFFVPAPAVPCRTLRGWVAYSTGGAWLAIRFVSRRTGRILHESTISSGAYSEIVLTGVDAPDVIDFYVQGSASFTLYALGLWWDVRGEGALPGVTYDSAWGSWLSQSFYSAGRADSSYLLRWLARKANQLVADRPPMAVCRGGGPGATAYFPVLVSPLVPSIKVYSSSTSTARFRKMSDLSYSGNYAFSGGVATIPTAFSEPTAVMVEVSGGIASPWYVTIVETPASATDLGLPGAETVPASFVDLADASLLARTPIRADQDALGSAAIGRAALVKNLVWLAAKKTRVLACAGDTTILSGSGVGPRRLFVASDDGWEKQIRLRAMKERNYVVPGPGPIAPGNQNIAWAEWTDDNGSSPASTWKDLDGEPVPGYETEQTPSGLLYTMESIASATVAHKLAANASFFYRRRWYNPDTDAYPYEDFLGGIVEELPDGTPLTSWP